MWPMRLHSCNWQESNKPQRRRTMQNKQLFDLGKTIRREVVGAEYDDVILNSESDFSQPIRDWTTENVWGTVWADETLSRKTRSLLNVALTVALRCPHEMKVH